MKFGSDILSNWFKKLQMWGKVLLIHLQQFSLVARGINILLDICALTGI